MWLYSFATWSSSAWCPTLSDSPSFLMSEWVRKWWRLRSSELCFLPLVSGSWTPSSAAASSGPPCWECSICTNTWIQREKRRQQGRGGSVGLGLLFSSSACNNRAQPDIDCMAVQPVIVCAPLHSLRVWASAELVANQLTCFYTPHTIITQSQSQVDHNHTQSSGLTNQSVCCHASLWVN